MPETRSDASSQTVAMFGQMPHQYLTAHIRWSDLMPVHLADELEGPVAKPDERVYIFWGIPSSLEGEVPRPDITVRKLADAERVVSFDVDLDIERRAILAEEFGEPKGPHSNRRRAR